MSESELRKTVLLSQDDIREALVEYACRRARVSGIIRHHVEIHGLWTTMGDGPAATVKLEVVGAPTEVGRS